MRKQTLKRNTENPKKARVKKNRATNYSKNKGSGFERRCVSIAKSKKLHAERMWGSDGRARGLPKDVDITVADIHCQCKKRARIASYIKIPKGCDATIIAEDYGKPLIVLDYEEYLEHYVQFMEVIGETSKRK